MSDRSDRDQATLTDMVRAARLTGEFVEGFDREGFLNDQKTQAAVLHEITIIGEGVQRLSDELRMAHPGIPWRLIAGMRNRLIHQYDTVDLEEVWKTITTDIPVFIHDLERIRSRSQQSSAET